MSKMDQYAAIRKKMEDAQAEMRKIAKDAFIEAAGAIFNKYPGLKNASWTMYTPYFNDGDECTFGVNEVDTINGLNRYDREGEDEDGMIIVWEDWMESACDDMNGLVMSFDNNTMQSVFGDHCKVTVYRDKIEVEEYEHD